MPAPPIIEFNALQPPHPVGIAYGVVVPLEPNQVGQGLPSVMQAVRRGSVM